MDNTTWKLPKLPPALIAVAPFLDLRAWASIVYLWLGFPLGLFWFIGMVVGFAVGLPLTLLWIGFAILAATLAAVWFAEGLERQLAIHLLGAEVPPRLPRAPGEKSPGVRQVLGSSALWKGMLFLLLRFPLGLAGWIFSLVSLVVSFTFMVAPWLRLTGWEDLDLVIDIDPLFWAIDSTLELWMLSALGLLLLILTFHAHRALGYAWARLAEWLLGSGAPATVAPSTPWIEPAPESSPA